MITEKKVLKTLVDWSEQVLDLLEKSDDELEENLTAKLEEEDTYGHEYFQQLALYFSTKEE